jgi:hypothetical protein
LETDIKPASIRKLSGYPASSWPSKYHEYVQRRQHLPSCASSTRSQNKHENQPRWITAVRICCIRNSPMIFPCRHTLLTPIPPGSGVRMNTRMVFYGATFPNERTSASSHRKQSTMLSRRLTIFLEKCFTTKLPGKYLPNSSFTSCTGKNTWNNVEENCYGLPIFSLNGEHSSSLLRKKSPNKIPRKICQVPL